MVDIKRFIVSERLTANWTTTLLLLRDALTTRRKLASFVGLPPLPVVFEHRVID